MTKDIRIATFFGASLIGIKILHPYVRGLSLRKTQDGGTVTPLLLKTSKSPLARGRIPELADYNFWTFDVLKDVVYPFLESRDPLTTHDARPIPHLSYAPRHLAGLYGLELRTEIEINDPAFVAEIESAQDVTLGMSIYNLRIFHEEIIRVFDRRGGLLNLHSGWLPDYRGLLTAFHELEDGEKVHGSTLHRITDRGIDTGEILDQAKRRLRPDKPILETYLDMADLGAAIALKGTDFHLGRVEHLPRRRPQDPNMGKGFTFPTAQEWRNWEARGWIFADPDRMLDIIERQFSVPGTTHAKALRAEVKKAWDACSAAKPAADSGEPLRMCG